MTTKPYLFVCLLAAGYLLWVVQYGALLDQPWLL